ncbi:MAG: hypothetical protein AAF468_05585 [Pseudomonadota bacterium]
MLNLKTTSLIALLTIGGFASPAFADCATDLQAVADARQSVALSEADAAAVEAAKTSAIEKQSAGDEEGCVADLAPAKAMLQIN